VALKRADNAQRIGEGTRTTGERHGQTGSSQQRYAEASYAEGASESGWEAGFHAGMAQRHRCGAAAKSATITEPAVASDRGHGNAADASGTMVAASSTAA